MNKLYKCITALIALVVTVTAYAQDDANTYIISDGTVNYKFNLIPHPNSLELNYINPAGTKQNETISSIDDAKALDVVLTKFSVGNKELISVKLQAEYHKREAKQTLNEYAKKIENEKGDIIGVLNGKTPVKSFLYYENDKGEMVSHPVDVVVDSVDIAFENGVIKDILVRARNLNDETLSSKLIIPANSNFQLSNRRYFSVRNAEDVDWLTKKDVKYLSFPYSKDVLVLMDLADVLFYNRKIPFGSGTYVPVDTTVTIVPEKKDVVKLHKSSISELFDIRLYSDMLGLNTTNPNGLIQCEAQLKFILKQDRRTPKTTHLWRFRNWTTHRYQIAPVNFIIPYMKMTKIENTNNKLSIASADIKDSTAQNTMLDLFKYSHLNVGTELNLIAYKSDSKLFTANFAGGVFRTTVGNDSIEKNNVTVSTAYLNPTLRFGFFESNKIDFEITFGGFGAWTLKNIDSTALQNAKVAVNSYKFTDNLWVQAQQSINLHPGGNRQSSIFIRSAQYYSTRSNFFTFQIGYSTSLSNLLKF